MATALIIHAPEDALPARALAEKLRAAKLTVLLEKAAGDETREAAKTAQVTIALWSPRSVGQAALVDDVAFARGKSKVVHAQMQNAQPPDQFRGDKAVNLTGWRGEDEIRALARPGKAGDRTRRGAAVGAASATAPIRILQPGRLDPTKANAPDKDTGGRPRPQQRASAPRTQPPPRQSPPARPTRQTPTPSYDPNHSEPKRGGGTGFIIGIIALIVIGGGAAGGYFWWQGQQTAHASAAAFDQIDRNDPAALRAFIASQSGPVKEQAQGALNELEERSYEAASDADTVDALQGFLHDFPSSQHALAARGRIAELQANPDSTTDTSATTLDQPTEGDQVAPGAGAASATGGPAPLTPPGEPSTSQEPPSAPATTTTTTTP